MKKTYLILLILSGMIYSCSNNEIIETNKLNEPVKIKFRSLRDKILTRVASDNGHPYSVYSFIDGDENWYMEDLEVSNSDVIANNQVFYWPRYDTLSFFAYCPLGDGSIKDIQTTVNPPSITMYYEPLGEGTDFTIATSVKQARERDVDNVNVVLSFKHKLAKIDLTINLSDTLVQSNYLLNEGTSGSVEDGNDSVYWASIRMPFNRGLIDVATAVPEWTLTDNTPATFDRNRTFLVLPQSFNESSDSCVIQFKNIIVTRNDIVVFQDSLLPYKLKTADIPDSAFIMGNHYIINFTLNPTSKDEDGNPIFGEAMLFGSSVSNWGDSISIPITQP